jgi:hypothetical protein
MDPNPYFIDLLPHLPVLLVSVLTVPHFLSQLFTVLLPTSLRTAWLILYGIYLFSYTCTGGGGLMIAS